MDTGKGITATIAVATAIIGGTVYLTSGADVTAPSSVAGAAAVEPQRVTLRCPTDGHYDIFYSFTAGVLPTPPDQQVDLLYLFNSRDSTGGSLMAYYLFPIGHRSWSELATLAPPLEAARAAFENEETCPPITPLDRDKEGLAFWVGTSGREFYVVRIRSVAPASYTDLVAGGAASVELEWLGPRTR